MLMQSLSCSGILPHQTSFENQIPSVLSYRGGGSVAVAVDSLFIFVPTVCV